MKYTLIFLGSFALALLGVYATITFIQDNDKFNNAKNYYITIAETDFKPFVIFLYLITAAFIYMANYSFWLFIAAISVWKF